MGERGDGPGRRPALVVAATASLGAGAVHAAAVGAHAEHPAVVRTFTAVAIVQLAWGAAALVRPHRWLSVLGAVAGLAGFVGWVLAKTSGIGFIDGLEVVEPAQWADTAAAVLAALSGAAAGFDARPAVAAGDGVPLPVSALARRGATVLAAAVGVVALTALPAAASHQHDHGDAHGEGGDGAPGHQHDHGDAAAGHDHAASIASAPYDPLRPIDLSGVAGVTPEQQARAENLVATTLWKLPQFADPVAIEALGYHSIGDAGTGYEHLVNWSLLDDGHQLDPDRPESVVFRVGPSGERTLVSAMYFAETGVDLDHVPDIGGALTQWHVHGDLCFTPTDPPRLAGLTTVGGPCPAGTRDLGTRPMIHVWIVPHRCGPFAALDGVGAGQVRAGEVTSCDHAHGAH